MTLEEHNRLIKVANFLRHISDVMFKASVEAKITRGRGRPPKEEKVVKRGRGRPRKVQ